MEISRKNQDEKESPSDQPPEFSTTLTGRSGHIEAGDMDKHPDDSDELLDENYANQSDDRVVRHIMVIGFHHKHGYQVDYCYPPLEPGGPVFSSPSQPIRLPSCWKTLPLLCLPDGSHNYDSDTIYFTMPDRLPHQNKAAGSQSAAASEGIRTIFGTACYRQIQADKLRNRTDDMTRIAVQKSVCVLSTKPLFGLIRSKLEMITHAYFEELDFSKVRILKLTYENLNSLLSRDSIKENATHLGLSARELIAQFGCNVLVLFKAMLLEKKILFYKTPVRDLCSTIMSMCSLFTGLLEDGGLDYSTCDLKLSPDLLEALKLSVLATDVDEPDQASVPAREDKVFFSPQKEQVVIMSDKSDQLATKAASREKNQPNELMATDQTGEFEMINETEEETADEVASADGSLIADDDPYAVKLCRMKPEECGLPLRIFSRGSFCLPYLSISYLDLISDTRVRSFVIGATNFLFKQRQGMYDVIVDMEENNIIIINDPALRKSLSLTTEDLRFMDYLSRQVKLDSSKPRDEFDLISQDITKWVGGDEWIRYHFRLYTLYLLKASKRPASNWNLFNGAFVHAWKQSTNNYKLWDSLGKSAMLENLQNRHPFSSSAKGINFSDMKLKLSYAVNSSEKGKLINQTLNGIGRWSIWNNIASAATAASSTISSASATVAATSASIMADLDSMGEQQQQPQQTATIRTGDNTNQQESGKEDLV